MHEALKIFLIFLFIIINYLLGSFPSGLVLGKLAKKVDIRQHGSKNIGATNTYRVLGKVYGVLAGFLDILKGALFIGILRIGFEYDIKFFNDISFIKIGGHTIHFYPIYGLFAVYGHIYSVFLKFNGGKAVATTLGVIAAISPITAVIGIMIFLLITNATKYVSLGSLSCATYMLATTYVYYIFFNKDILMVLKFDNSKNFLGNFIEYSIYLLVTTILFVIIFIRHKENIKRLINGEEKTFFGDKKKTEQ